ncbi:MAG: 3D domain-containing protein [Acidobacteria bacterium]|nr:3D domain-containing protein [Acidobacteriota bacterium]
MKSSRLKRNFANLVTVAVSSIVLVLPILFSNPTDTAIEAANHWIEVEPMAPARSTELRGTDSGTHALAPYPAAPITSAPSLRPQTFLATAYSLPGKTFTGAPVRRGIVASDPRVLPMGSIIRIIDPDYKGTYTVLDTGPNLRGRMIDIYVPTRREAVQFGARRVKVEVVKKGR